MKNASEELRERIIESRKDGLLRETDKFKDEISKLTKEIVNYCSGGK